MATLRHKRPVIVWAIGAILLSLGAALAGCQLDVVNAAGQQADGQAVRESFSSRFRSRMAAGSAGWRRGFPCGCARR
jgi:hypothetical protein